MQVTWETQFRSLGQEDPLEEGVATHSSILAWRIPGREEPGGLHSTGWLRDGHNWSHLVCTLISFWYIYISFGEICIQKLSTLFSWTVYLLIVESCVFVLYSEHNSLIQYMIYKNFLPVCGFSFNFLNSVFWRPKNFHLQLNLRISNGSYFLCHT